MNNNSTSSLISEWIQQHKKATIIFTSLFFLIAVIIPAFTIWTTVRLDVRNETGFSDIKLSYYTSDDLQYSEKKKAYPLFGLLLVRRNSDVLISKSDKNTETHSYLNKLPAFGMRKISVTHIAQKKVNPLGVGGYDCLVGNEFGKFSYSCGAPELVYSFQRPNPTPSTVVLAWDSVPDQNTPLPINTRPYRDGLLAITDDSEGKKSEQLLLYFIKPGRSALNKTIPVPKILIDDKVNFAYLTIYTDTTSKDNTGFVLSDTLGKRLYNFTTFEDKNPQRIVLPQEGAKIITEEGENPVDYAYAQLVQLVNRTIYYYSGILSTPLDNPNIKTTKEGKTPQGLATVGRIQGGSHAQYKLINFAGIDGFLADKYGALYTTQGDDRLSRLILDDKNKSFHTEFFTSGVMSPSANSRGLFYVNDHGLFTYDSANNTSHLVFNSARLKAANVLESNGHLFMNAIINDSQIDTPQVAYEVFDDGFTQEKRFEDVAPYPPGELPAELITYDNNRIYAKLNFEDVFSDQQTGQFIVNGAEYKTKTTQVRERLAKDGLLKEGMQLLFNYYPPK